MASVAILRAKGITPAKIGVLGTAAENLKKLLTSKELSKHLSDLVKLFNSDNVKTADDANSLIKVIQLPVFTSYIAHVVEIIQNMLAGSTSTEIASVFTELAGKSAATIDVVLDTLHEIADEHIITIDDVHTAMDENADGAEEESSTSSVAPTPSVAPTIRVPGLPATATRRETDDESDLIKYLKNGSFKEREFKPTAEAQNIVLTGFTHGLLVLDVELDRAIYPVAIRVEKLSTELIVQFISKLLKQADAPATNNWKVTGAHLIDRTFIVSVGS